MMRLPKLGIATVVALFTVVADTSVNFYSLTSLPVPKVLAQTNSEKKAEADRLLQQGIQQFQNSRFREASQSLQQALTIFQEIGDRKSEKAALRNLSIAYSLLGDYRKAIEYQQQILAIARETGDRKGEGRALGNLGFTYLRLRDYRKAIDYFQQYLAIARETGDRQDEAHSLRNLSIAYRYLREYPKVIQYQEQSLAIARSIGDRKAEGEALGNLGKTFLYLGDYRKAIEYQQQSLTIVRSIGDRKAEGAALRELGSIYNFRGKYHKAIEYYQQFLPIAREIGDRKAEGAALRDLGKAYNALGDYRKAIEYRQQSLAVKRETGDRKGEGEVLGDLGRAYNYLGEYRKAIEYQQQRLAIAREIGDRFGEGLALGNLGIAYYSLGDYRKAIEYQQQRLAIAREITIARKFRDIEGEGTTLYNLSLSFYKSGNLAEAEKSLFEGIKAFESMGEKLGNDADAIKVSQFDQQAYSYRFLQQVLIDQNKTATALEISERGRARAFVELLIRRRSANTQKIIPATSLIPTIEQIKQIAQKQNSTLVQYSIVSDDFKIPENEPTSIIFDGSKILEKNESKELELYIWVIKPTGEVNFRKVDLKPLWQQQNTSLAKLVTNSRESIGVRGIVTATIARQPEINETQNLQKLHELLIKPIADLLPTDPNNHIIFIPQKELFLVPFVALLDEKGKYLIEKHTILTAPSIQVLELTHSKREHPNFANIYVGAKHSGSKSLVLTNNLSAGMLRPYKIRMLPSKKPRAQSSQILIVGNPTMPYLTLNTGETPEQLPPLPAAEQEAMEIAKQFNTKALIGSEAKEAKIKSRISQANIIHFATHAIFDYGERQINDGEVQVKYRPGVGLEGALAVPGALAFTPDDKEDGLLTSDEILDLKLNASLVVLSACDTGRGQLTSDGVVGLYRAFITAGTPSIVVSLWAVPDAPTADLMKEFYQQMRTNPNKAQALRQAMLTTMKTHPHPRDWAAFTFIGEAF